ncbi:polysaccharide biosynthesis/export family protein [Candidatus Nitrospira salsa]|nr:MAG: sugar ABC transporter substrate-binding protein [Nitrospirales bacterium]
MIAGLIITLIFFLAACSPSVVVKSPTSVGSPGTTVGQVGPTLMKEYIIQPGDELDIKFFYNPDLNELVTVRPDGRISLQLVGETIAAGRTPYSLTELLKKEYDRELKQPEITVIVRSFGARIFVDGEVEKPGELELTGPLTVMQAISRAEGATDEAWDQALIIRRIQGKQPFVIAIDIKSVLSGEDFSQDIGLVPFDIVYVPRSPIADVNLWVDQYIRQNIPIRFGAFFPLN